MAKKPDTKQKGALGRILRRLFHYYPVLAPLTVACILFFAVVSAVPALFIQRVLTTVEACYRAADWSTASQEIIPTITLLIVLYVLALLSEFAYTQLMAYMTQGFLCKLRREMFNGMQNLPVRYFDTHQHGDIMSYYTNDIDTLRQMISQSFPLILKASVIVLAVFCIMLYYSLWMTLILLIGVVAMLLVTKFIGGGSARYFIRQQKSLADVEGLAQELMNGQKVIKVFCHEQESIADFDRVNEQLYQDARKANTYANTLAPIIGNIGNVMYAALALCGGVFLLSNIQNISISGMAFSIPILIPFLNMAKQFTGNVNQLTQQINSIVMAAAGADRIFDLIDQQPEEDDGTITLANIRENADGSLTDCGEEHTGHWAWKLQENGSTRYVPLRGDVQLDHVDFGYVPEKTVLHDVSVSAKPGQKIAFVGATGAGKTTITNLINRFYDISKGTISYDGIPIHEIRKADLRRSMGLVLQETNLFTGSVMENIRYGRLDATDEDCRAAARLAGADDFISRLPEGYDTLLHNNGANLSQGQRQLIAIARAAVADPPVMILDEATSSIDTRTEAIVQRGMDKLMEGRTVFVIAHRLSTVRNSDVIMVLDQGHIIEKGSHEALIAKKGTYYQLYTGAFELE